MSKEEVIKKIQELEMKYEIVEHGPVYTMEDMEKLDSNIFKGAKLCKNLFLRDAKGKRHFLVIVPEEKRVNLSNLSEIIGSSKLSFASPERLKKYLGAEQGCVSPLSVIYDKGVEVEVFIDKQLEKEKIVAVHPNDNAYSVLITLQNIIKYIKENGNEVQIIKL